MGSSPQGGDELLSVEESGDFPGTGMSNKFTGAMRAS